MRGLIYLIEALILGGSVGTKFVLWNSLVRRKSVVKDGCPLLEKVPPAEPVVIRVGNSRAVFGENPGQ